MTTRSLLSIVSLVGGIGCADPVPDLPPATSRSAPRATLGDEQPEGSIDVFGLRMPAKSSIKRKTPRSTTLDVPMSVEQTSAYVKERIQDFTQEDAKAQVIFSNAAPKSKPDMRLRIVLRPTSLSTEVTVLWLRPASTGSVAPVEPEVPADPPE